MPRIIRILFLSSLILFNLSIYLALDSQLSIQAQNVITYQSPLKTPTYDYRFFHVSPNGVSVESQKLAEQYAEWIFNSLSSSKLALLQTRQVTLEIIPHSNNITRFFPFDTLKDQNGFDNRSYSTMSSIGPVTASDGITYYAVHEDELKATPSIYYGQGFVITHETGHLIHVLTLPPTEETQLEDIWQQHMDSHTAMVSDYSKTNSDEYFADSTAAYLNQHYNPHNFDNFNRDWLKLHDSKMYIFLEQIYSKA